MVPETRKDSCQRDDLDDATTVSSFSVSRAVSNGNLESNQSIDEQLQRSRTRARMPDLKLGHRGRRYSLCGVLLASIDLDYPSVSYLQRFVELSLSLFGFYRFIVGEKRFPKYLPDPFSYYSFCHHHSRLHPYVTASRQRCWHWRGSSTSYDCKQVSAVDRYTQLGLVEFTSTAP
jgi:hypothetical protein